MAEQKLNIGFVVPAMERGGLENIVAELYRHGHSLGHKCTIFVEGDSVAAIPEGVEVDDLVVINRSEIQFFSELMAREIDVLHYNYSTFMLEEASRAGIGIIYVLHNAYIWLSDDEFMRRAAVLKRADTIIAVSSFARDYFVSRSQFGASDPDIIVIENGIESSKFRRTPVGVREKYGIKHGEFVFVCVATFNRVKHQMLVIGAAERLAKVNHNFKVFFIGGAGDRNYYSEVKTYASRSKARDSIVFCGHKDAADVEEIISGLADCAVLPSLIEGCGNAALEAAAAGLPVIMTRTGIASDLAQLFDNVIIVETAADAGGLNYGEIDRLSRIVDAPNLTAFAKAMRAVMETNYRRPPVDDFPFERSFMLKQHSSLWPHIARKNFIVDSV